MPPLRRQKGKNDMPKENNEDTLFGSQGFIIIPKVEKFSACEKMADLKSRGYIITKGSGISAEVKQTSAPVKWLKRLFIPEAFTPIPIRYIGLNTNLGDQTEEAVGDITLQYADIIQPDPFTIEGYKTVYDVLQRLWDEKRPAYVGLAPIFALMEHQSKTGNGSLVHGNNLFFVQNPGCGVVYIVRVVLREQLSLFSGAIGFADPTIFRRAFFPPFFRKHE